MQSRPCSPPRGGPSPTPGRETSTNPHGRGTPVPWDRHRLFAIPAAGTRAAPAPTPGAVSPPCINLHANRIWTHLMIFKFSNRRKLASYRARPPPPHCHRAAPAPRDPPFPPLAPARSKPRPQHRTAQHTGAPHPSKNHRFQGTAAASYQYLTGTRNTDELSGASLRSLLNNNKVT